MKNILLLLTSGFIIASLSAQTCDCEKEFAFVRDYMERNHPGLNSGTKNTKAYKKGVAELKTEIRKVKPGIECNLYLDEYLSLVKDHHVRIDISIPPIKRPDVNSPSAMDSFYHSAAFKSTLKRKVDTIKLIPALMGMDDNSIEGLYSDGNGNLVAFVKEPDETWSYKGIAVRSNSLFYPVGTVRYEIRQRPNGLLWAMVLLPDHQRLYTQVKLSRAGLLNIGLRRVSDKFSAQPFSEPFEFRMVSDSTAYVRLSSFDGKYFQQLQSFYTSIDSQLMANPYLIIDVRGNGGGSEENYEMLKKYIYSGPVKYGKMEMWVSPDNIRRYEEAASIKKQNTDKYSKGSIERDERLASQMRSAPQYAFLPLGQDIIISPDSVLSYPRKIVVLMDGGTGSSAEGFIAFARQSTKVITMGENSGGYVGYGDVMPVKTPCYGYTIWVTSFRYSSMYQYEFVGFTPHIKLSPDKDWIKEALEVLKKK